MAGIDPRQAFNLVQEVRSAVLQATLELALPADLLHAKISVGDVLPAVVLPPEHGQDFIEVLGARLPAQLPPGIHPGETLVLTVTAIGGNRIVMQNMGPLDPQNPPEFTRIPVATAPPPQPARAAPGLQAPDLSRSAPPPREVFTAASVRAASVPAAPAGARAAIANLAQRISKSAGDLLKLAKFPDTAATRTIAAISPQAPARVPAVLARLDAALPAPASDPRIATLKTLIGFLSSIDPRNEQSLHPQIEAYVSHVVEGSEPKLQQLLRALVQSRAPAQPQMPPEAASQAHARAAERSTALAYQLKPLVLSLLADPPASRTPALTQALNETFLTLTATQLSTLSANAQTPGSYAFTLPVLFQEGVRPAHIRISREAGTRAPQIDADTFHVAFVLETAHLGAVSIDLQSVGRTVKIDVKTERAGAAGAFASTLGGLRSRLERLRYRVASAAASALSRKPPQAPPARAAGLDFRA